MTFYGFWLPNDPRGSWSDYVRTWEIYWYGSATKIDERRSVAHTIHDRNLRAFQKTALRYDPVELTGLQALRVGQGFAKAILESSYRVRACSILPSHVHLVVDRHDSPAERIAGHLKARATQSLISNGLHPFAAHCKGDDAPPRMWSRRSWKVFLNDDDDIERAIKYVQENPLKEGKPLQKWAFVVC